MKIKTVYDLKPAFQSILRPLAQTLAKRGFTANQVTVTALLMSLASGAITLLFRSYTLVLYLLPLVLFMRMAFNAIDGMMAREHHQESQLGAYLNELGDVVADAAMYLPLALLSPFSPVLITILVVLAVVVEFAGVLPLRFGKPRGYAGPFGKSDRALFFSVIALAVATGLVGSVVVNAALGIAVVLSLRTIINRVHAGLREEVARAEHS